MEAARSFADYVASLDAKSISVISHSHGTNVAIEATDHGKRVAYRRLVCLSTPFRRSFRPRSWAKLGRLYNVQADRDAVVALARGRARSPSGSGAKSILLRGIRGHSQSHSSSVWEEFGLGHKTGLWPRR